LVLSVFGFAGWVGFGLVWDVWSRYVASVNFLAQYSHRKKKQHKKCEKGSVIKKG
jgi:hypothetical protein